VRRANALAAAVLAGALLILSFPKWGTGAVAWIALIPLFHALTRLSGRWAGRLAYVSGLVASVGLLYWTGLVVVQYGGLSRPLGLAAMLALCLVVALFFGLFGALVGLWLRAFGPRAILAAPLAWVAVEWLRASGPLSFPWCLLGYSQHDNLPVAQLASLTGVYGLSFVVAASASLVAGALRARLPRERVALAGLLVLLVGGVWGFGRVRLASPIEESGRLRVGLVQASVAQEEKWDDELALRNVEWHAALTRQAAGAGAELVVWPESAVPFYYDWDAVDAARLRALAGTTGVHLLFGNDDFDRNGGQPRIFVGAKMLAPDGRLTLRYHKMQLVPFGEYVPMQGLLGALGVRRLVERVGSFTPGDTAAVGDCLGHSLGVTICYEAIFPGLVRRFTVNGAELLANVTNDGWYGRTSAPYQHLAMARLRAVENGRALVRAANTGISALVDPRGRIIGATELFARTSLVGEVPLTRALTFYGRRGDVFAWSCVVATALLSLVAGWRLLRRGPAIRRDARPGAAEVR
jgi:apolipoprotein N-acyltransferase